MPTSDLTRPVPRWLLVTRHAGAVMWLQDHLGLSRVDVIDHLDERCALSPGDRVAGNLPLALAADLCSRGVVVLGIDLPLSPYQRGIELDAATMRAVGARLRRYRVLAEPWPEGLHQAAAADSHERLPHAGAKSGREE